MSPPDLSRPQIAWAIHVFTAVGIIAGFLALLSALDGSPRASLTWMMVAMVIDGLDGPIARRYEISAVLPHIDGHVMDLIIDYVTTVVAPAFFIHEFGLLPKGFGLLGVSLMLLSALYLFSLTDIMTEDHYFRGFPAMWNLVVNVMFVLQSPRMVNAVIVVVLTVFTIVPVRFIHPVRVRDLRSITLPVLVIWLAALVRLTWILKHRTEFCAVSCLGTDERIMQAIVYLGALWIVGVGVARTIKGAPLQHHPPEARPA
ncbi:MAG: hypothetical protein R2698_08425 [Microthrixaceae bacterium]